MRWLGIDLETTGLDVENDKIIEVGAVVWDTDRKQPLDICSVMVKHEDLVLPEAITKITGIRTGDLFEFGQPFHSVVMRIKKMAEHVDAVVAHNAHGFDKPLLVNQINAMGATDVGKMFHGKQWIDTAIDLPYNENIKRTNLFLLGAQHGFLNPFAHRAVTDVLSMLQIAACYDTAEIMRLATSPLVALIADVSFQQKDLAKENGFYWQSETKQWKRNLKECQIADLKLPFKFEVLKI